MKNVSGCRQISYGELYLHKLRIVEDAFCRFRTVEEETQRHPMNYNVIEVKRARIFGQH